MEILQKIWKQHLRPRAVVGYGVKIFLPSPQNYVTRSPGGEQRNQGNKGNKGNRGNEGNGEQGVQATGETGRTGGKG